MSADNPSPEGPGSFPEVRLKAGFRNPGSSGGSGSTQVGPVEEIRRNGPLSFDEMLEFTRAPKSSPDSGPSRPTPPPPPPPTPVYTQAEAQPQAMPERPAFTSLPIDSEPITLDLSPPPPPQMMPPPDVRSPAALLTSKRPKSDLWKPAGAGALGFAVLVMLVLGIGSFFSGPTRVLINSKPKGATVFLGEERLGETPVEVELDNLEVMPVLELEGYETQTVPQIKQPARGETGKVYVILEKRPFPLDWAGLPPGTKVWWEGSESKPESTVAGAHDVKIKPPGQSSFAWSVSTPWKDGAAFPIGKAIAGEIKKRPVLKLSLSGVERADVIVKDGPRFTKTVSMKKGDSALTLPGPGKYRVMVKATGAYAPFEQQVDLKEGAKKSVEVALWRPVAAPAAAPSSSYGGGWSQPTYSQPRSAPRASYSGGGGGSGRIAPPSF